MRNNLENLSSFVRRQVTLGKLGANSAQSYMTSIDRVFQFANDQEKADVLAADLEALFARFRAGARIQENTMASYEGRVRAAINSFSAGSGPDDDPTAPASMAPLTIPLRSGVVSVSGLPADLTEAEARRVASVIIAMAS